MIVTHVMVINWFKGKVQFDQICLQIHIKVNISHLWVCHFVMCHLVLLGMKKNHRVIILAFKKDREESYKCEYLNK